MARNMYGATSADFTITSGGRVIPGAVLTLWTARTGGTQITDLLDVNSVATTTVTSASDGSVVYYGPNNDKTVHWADSGQGSRVAIRPTDITGDPPVMSIGTVGTGTAAASLTGTSEAPVLNLTLPSAGANGVNTAAIQDSAVTSAKIADGTITSTDVAASTFAAFGTQGNLLTDNQASGTDTLGDTTGFTVYSAATITSDLTPYSGTRSVKAVATGNAGMTFGLPGSTVTATVGQTYTAEVTTAATDAAASELILAFYDSGGTWIGQASKAYTGGGWRTVQITGVAPASTAAVSAYIYQTTTTAGVSTVYADQWGLWKGAGGQWAMPGTPIVGGSHIATNGAVHLSGTGTPEGVITAAPGSTWLQTDSITDVKGWIKWVKATGTGSTGWVAGADADTGWRDISSLFNTAIWTPSATIKPALRRTGTTVFLAGRIESAAAWSAVAALTSAVPTGFRTLNARAQTFPIRTQSGGVAGPGAHHNGISESGELVLTRNAAIATGNADAANTIAWITSQWTTRDAWPASLPGEAV